MFCVQISLCLKRTPIVDLGSPLVQSDVILTWLYILHTLFPNKVPFWNSRTLVTYHTRYILTRQSVQWPAPPGPGLRTQPPVCCVLDEFSLHPLGVIWCYCFTPPSIFGGHGTGGLLRWLSSKDPTCRCRRHGFDPWVGKTPRKRKWQPTLVFLSEKSHGQRNRQASVHGVERVRHKWVIEKHMLTWNRTGSVNKTGVGGKPGRVLCMRK